jgi:hypothetical protein
VAVGIIWFLKVLGFGLGPDAHWVIKARYLTIPPFPVVFDWATLTLACQLRRPAPHTVAAGTCSIKCLRLRRRSELDTPRV